jgi:hypothetical protein
MLIYYIDTAHYGVNLSINRNEIKQTVQYKKELLENQFEKLSYEKFVHTTPVWLQELLLNNIFEYNVGVMKLEDLFNRYLQECNYILIEELTQELEFEVDEKQEKVEFEYDDIPTISRDELKELQHKKMTSDITELEKASIEKFWFLLSVLDVPDKKLEKDIWDIYNEYNKSKFRKLSFEKGFENKLFSLTDIIDSANYSILSNDIALQLEKIVVIKKLLGINNTQQNGLVISKEQLDEISPKLLEMKKEIYSVFSLRDQSKEFNVLSMLNMIWDKWGLTDLKKGKQKQKMTGGIRVDKTPVIITNKYDIDVYKYIAPRNKHRPPEGDKIELVDKMSFDRVLNNLLQQVKTIETSND